VIHLLVSNKHIQCIKWDHEDGKPFLSSVSYVPYRSKKLTDIPSDKELINEINTVLQLQKKKFSFEGEQVYVTIPDSFCSTSVVYPDEEMSEADGWELSKWTIGQRFTKEEDSNDEFFGRYFSQKTKNIYSLKVSSLLTETIKISIQELGGNPLWMGSESSSFFGLNPNRGITLLINDKSGYEYYHYSKNCFTNGFAKYSKKAWKLSSSDGSVNENDIFKGQVVIPGKLSYRRKSHFEGKRIRQVEPFKNIKKNDVKIPKELTIYSQAISTALIRGEVIGNSLNFFNNPGLQGFQEAREADEVITPAKEKVRKRKKLSKKKKSNFQQFFAYLFFFGALSAVIFREQLPYVYEKIESEVRSFLNPPSPAILSDDQSQANPNPESHYFNKIDFVRSQSLAYNVFNMISLIDSDQIHSFDVSQGKMNIILTGSKNSLFPIDTLGNILNYSLRQIEGKDLYEFGYLVQYDPFFNETLKASDYVSLIDLLDDIDKFIDVDIKKFESFSQNAIEHTPIIVSSTSMNAFKDILDYILSTGSNLILHKTTMDKPNDLKSNTLRLFITYLNYTDN
tara:strand:+ start:2986 stop:4683 length:1698 start_codon:yes stop_codon:yes gene_type:complete